MAASGSKSFPTIGFFTVTEDAETGFVGGLLVLNAVGRPLEFHCTAPLKPNRAQEILYGPALRPFLYGEQIGTTLASKAKSDTLFLCTDVEPAMCLRDAIETPLLLVQSQFANPSAETGPESPPPANGETAPAINRPAYARLREFSLGLHAVAVLERHSSDRDQVQERWQPYADYLDLWEPFGRIREALFEAQRGAAK
jgi:hypothetical protein